MAFQFPGQVPGLRDPAPTSKLRMYLLKAGRMPSRKIPLLPKFGCSTIVPGKSQVSYAETRLSDTTNTPSRNTRLNNGPRNNVPTKHRGKAIMPIVTTGAFWLPAPHMGDPCTICCLDHILSCGHKVITVNPEPCALNCHSRQHPDLLQPRDIGSPFVCTACIVEHLAQRHAERQAAYVGELLEAASDTQKGEAWVEEKLSFVSLAWRDEDVAEFRALYTRGRPSTAPWFEPEFQDVVDIASEGEALGRGSSVSTLVEISRPPSPAPTTSSVASKTASVFSSWRRSGWVASPQ